MGCLLDGKMVTKMVDVENMSQAEVETLLKKVSEHYSIRNLARMLGLSVPELRATIGGKNALEPTSLDTLALLAVRPRAAENPSFRFIDLFAGVGGTRLGFENAGGRCVFTSERDQPAVETYSANFASTHEISGDITEIDAETVPSHDVLVAGFPCQPFSLAGISKKNSLGRKHGFEDETQGTLFFDIARILKEKQPPAFMLENVKNLRSHDQGKTFKVIIKTLTDLGYYVQTRVMNGLGWVPQNRERVIIVGFKDSSKIHWSHAPGHGSEDVTHLNESPSGVDLFKINAPETRSDVGSILHSDINSKGMPQDNGRYADPATGAVLEKYTLTDNLWRYLREHKEKHARLGNGFGFGLFNQNSEHTRTISARYHKDGSEILIEQEGKNPRRLTPREAARLMGFPDSFIIPVSDTQAYRQFGNSVVVPLISAVATEIAAQLRPTEEDK